MTDHFSKGRPALAIADAILTLPVYAGLVANNWAKLEHAMVPLMRVMLQTSDYAVAKIVLFSANPPQRRDMLVALAESRFSKEISDEVKAFCDEFDRLRILRNDIVHGHWDGLSPSGNPLLRSVKSRTSLKETITEREIEWVRQVADDLDVLSARAEPLEQKIQTILRP